MSIKPRQIKAKNIADFISEFEKKWDQIKQDLLDASNNVIPPAPSNDPTPPDDTQWINIDDVFNNLWDEIGNLCHDNGSDVVSDPTYDPQPDPSVNVPAVTDPAANNQPDPVDPNDPVYDPSVDDGHDAGGDGGGGDHKDDGHKDDDHKDHDKK